MKLKDCRANEDYYSGEVSKIGRNLGFVGIATVWIFKTPANTVPPPLLLPLCILLGFFAFDFLQYLVGYCIWTRFLATKEEQLLIDDGEGNQKFDEDKDFVYPNWPYRTLVTFFVLKLVALVAAYGFLLWHFISLTIKPELPM